MTTDRREHGCRAICAAALVLLLSGRTAWGYVEAPYTLGKIISESTNVILITVEAVDKQKHTIVYRKVRDVKGIHPGETIKHFIGQNGFHPREWQNVMAWAEVGKTALFFHNRSAGEVCVDNYWYQVYAGDWWNMSHAEPFLLRSYAGKPEKLATAVSAMLGGQEVVVPCMVDGDKNALHLRNAKMQRMKASLKLDSYNPKRDFVDWGAGGDEFRAIAGMPGFTHYLALGTMGSGAVGVAPGDFAGNGKVGLCLFGAGRLSLLQNAGGAFDDVQLPYRGGARAAAWADYDGDGKLDLLLATPSGPKLFHNDGKQFDDTSAALPDDGYYNLTAAAWIDFDGDGKPDILLADGFRGLRLYRNLGASAGLPGQPKVSKWFYAGPFDNPNKKGFEVVHPPERELDLKKEYRGKNNELIVWKEGNFPDGRPNDLRLFRPGCNSDCVAYLYRELDFGGAGELPVVLGSGGTLAVWLNGERIHAETTYHALTADSVSLKLKLRPGKNSLLLKVCQCEGDFAFCFSMPRLFVDVSDQVGLGTGGVGGNLKGDRLVVADVNGDGRPDFLFSAGTGLLVLNTSHGFVEAKDSGISYQAGGVTPVFGDFNGDGRPDLFVPQRGTCKLFRNEGGGRFSDVTAQAGDLARPIGDARCAAWAEFSKRGRQDLFVGCLKGPNRYFRNNGDGTFNDATEEIGLTYRIFNTCGIAAVDLNNDGAPDVVLNNEGQESAVLLGNSDWLAAAEATKAAAGATASQEAVRAASPTATASKEAVAHDASPMGTASGEAVAHETSQSAAAPGAARKGSPGVENEADVRSSPVSLARGLSIGIVLIVIALGVGWHVVQSRLVRRVLLLSMVCCSSASADWPAARGNPQRTGNVDGISGPKAPKVLWVYKAQEHYVASPVPEGNAILIGGVGTYNTGVFHAAAIAPEAPDRLLWSKSAPFITRPTVCAPAVVDGLAVFGDGMHQTDDAVLYCLRAEDGLPVWQYAVPGRLVHLEAAPTIDKGRVYICGGDAGVLCVDMKRVTLDGKEQDVAAVIPTLAKRWADLLAKYEQDKQKLGPLALPPSDDAMPKPVPKLLWQQGKGKWHIDAPPAVVGDFVLVASAYLDDDKVGKRCLLCLRAGDGSVAWEAPLEINPWAGPTVADKLVLVGCSSIRFDRKLVEQAKGEVAAFDLATGQLRWREPARGGVLSPVAVKGDVAVYTGTDGKVVARNVAGGKHLWTYESKTPYFAGPAIAGETVYVADLKSVVCALSLADGKPQWALDVAADLSVQSRSMVFGSPVVHGGDLYLATCNLDGEADQPSVIACLSDKASGVSAAAMEITVDRQKRTVSIPCKIAPRKLPTLKEVYPLEVAATYPTPRGQKAHETIVTFECRPSEVHKALESLGLKPGKPARGEGAVAFGPEVKIFLEVPGFTDKPRLIPLEKAMVDVRTGKTMPPVKWHFTGSVMRQPDPEKEERVYGADLGGTLISLVPVTDEVVCQTNLTMKEEHLLKLETNKNLLPPEGADVKLIIQAK